MEQSFIDFRQQLSNKIEALNAPTNNSTSFLKKAFEIVKKEVKAMNAWQETYVFKEEEQEKHFYKSIRPHLIAHFKYFQERYEWELKAPLIEAEQVTYYEEKHKIVTEKLSSLAYVKDYLQTEENDHYDIDGFFKTEKCEVKDWRPCFQHCLPIADYICYELQLAYLKETYSVLNTPKITPTDKLPWNGNLIDITEVVFAFYYSNSISKEVISLKKIAVAVESIIDIKISDNISNRWKDIAKRKQDPARFLRKLADVIELKAGKTL